MDNAMLKHTWTFNEQSWLLRFYATVWGASLKKVNFCKLFWAVVFAPLALLFWAVAGPAIWIHGKLPERPSEPAPFKPEPKPEPAEVPEWIAEFFAKPRVRAVCRVVGIGLLVLVALATVGIVAWLISKDVLGFLRVAGLVLGGLLAVALLFLWGNWMENRSKAKREAEGPPPTPKFFRFMAAGFRAVKSNTCPRVEVQRETP